MKNLVATVFASIGTACLSLSIATGAYGFGYLRPPGIPPGTAPPGGPMADYTCLTGGGICPTGTCNVPGVGMCQLSGNGWYNRCVPVIYFGTCIQDWNGCDGMTATGLPCGCGFAGC